MTELRQRVESAGLNASALADALGVTRQTVSLYMTGKQTPPPWRVRQIEKIIADSAPRTVEECGERISVSEAAKILGCNPQAVRIGMQRGLVPFGFAYKNDKKWSYIIPRSRLQAYIEGRL